MLQAMIMFDTGGYVPAPEIREVYSAYPIAIIIVLSGFIIFAYTLGRAHRATTAREAWSRVEILTAIGVAVMIATFIVTLLNVEVRKWLGLL